MRQFYASFHGFLSCRSVILLHKTYAARRKGTNHEQSKALLLSEKNWPPFGGDALDGTGYPRSRLGASSGRFCRYRSQGSLQLNRESPPRAST